MLRFKDGSVATYINDLEELTVGVEDEDLVFASLGQQNVILHHERDRSAIPRLSVVEVLQDWPVLEEICQLTKC